MGQPAKYATFEAAAPPSNPRSNAWWGSRLLLTWVSPLMALGQRKQLCANDIWSLEKQRQSKVLSARFMESFKFSRSIPRSFIKLFGLRFFATGIASLVGLLASLVGPLVLNHVVSSLTNATFSVGDISVWVVAMTLSQVLQALVDNYTTMESQLVAMEFVSCVKSLLYDKTMRLSTKSRMEKSTSDITNMYTSDSDAVRSLSITVHKLWLLPLQISIVSFMLYRLLHEAAFAGIGIIVITLIINHVISKGTFRMTRVYRSSRDARMKKVTEVFKAISIVKYNAWEERCLEEIQTTRTKELRDLLACGLYFSASLVLMWGMPVFISIASFGVYSVVLQRELTPAVVFTSLTLFQMIRRPLRFITHVITRVIQSKVALERVTEFLSLPEIDEGGIITASDPRAAEYAKRDVIIAMENASFGWDQTTSVLRNINLEIKVGDFYVVHGSVGCGKSSLCSALLGEIVKLSGTVYVGGSIAYCSQQPWIQNMTVRDNILFGLPFESNKYNKVIEACALLPDLASLPAGDLTEIGERGVNMSGGQKARIALARACYSDASIFLLDSPLSAVDAIVQNEIFTKCLLSLLRNKTIILVTHNPEIIASEHATHAITIDENGALVETRKTLTKPPYQPLMSPLAARKPEVMDTVRVATVTHSSTELTKDQTATESGKLIQDEFRAEGRTGGHVFAGYYRAVGGFPVVSVIVLSQVLWQSLQVASDFWLSSWSGDSVRVAERTELASSEMSTTYRLTVYSALGLLSAAMVLVRTLMVTFFGLKAAKYLFDRMTHSLIFAPMRFFDVNPIGRILTRYGSDIYAIDDDVPFAFGSLFAQVFSVGSCALTAAIVIQWKAIFLLPVAYLYATFGSFYIQPAREIQRLTLTSQAPVLSHLSESVDGVSVLRAYGSYQIERFQSTNFQKLDGATKIVYAELSVSQWFSLRIQLLGSALVLIVTCSLVVLHDELSPAVIGLAFSYALNVSQNLENIVDSLAYIETIMVSPERVQEYIDIPQEAPRRNLSHDPPRHPEWPSNGAIVFDDVSFRYKVNDKLVLREVTFRVEGGLKVGIVGRTGAGKTSLTMALFRINELASGTIRIDGVDIAKLGLATLREKLSIIPQNPVLFKGPLRAYLDPFNEYSDDKLWHAIRRVGLSDRIGSEEQKLECAVEENGDNFSVGERQMLCMARALLRQSRIVIFDEATAAIDRETDIQLQRVIRDVFAESTVLTIAHRLDTILDSDRIVVLEGGEIIEFASPAELVNKGSGHFFDLMQEGGYLEKFLRKVSGKRNISP